MVFVVSYTSIYFWLVYDLQKNSISVLVGRCEEVPEYLMRSAELSNETILYQIVVNKVCGLGNRNFILGHQATSEHFS